MVCLTAWHLLVISLYLRDLRWVIAIIGGILRRLCRVTHCPQVLIPDWVLLGANLEGVVTNLLQGYRVASLVTGYTVVSYFRKHCLVCWVPVKW